VIPPLLATKRVLPALRGVLCGDAALVARLDPAPAAMGGGPGIYTAGHIPADARPDYLVVGPFTERSTPTMGEGRRWGSELTAAIKLVSKSPDVAFCQDTLERVLELLHGQPLTVADYDHGMATLDNLVDSYPEMVAGGRLWNYPTLWTVRVHQ